MEDLLTSDQAKVGLTAKLDNAKVLLQLLKVLQFKDEVVVHATSNGIKVTADVSRSFFGSAFIQKETFADYSLNLPNAADNSADEDAEMVFNISLFTLVQCLNVTGGGGGGGTASASGAMSTLVGGGGSTTSTFSKNVSPSLLLHFPEVGQPLYIWLEENGIVTGATIPTLDLRDDGYVDFASMMQQNNTRIVARVILQAEHLCNIFAELESAKSDTLDLSVCPKNRCLTMSTSSAIVTKFSVEIPFDSEIVNHFQVDEFVSTKYQLSTLKHALKPMAMAEKVSIRFDSRRFLSIQYMIKLTDTACFMEFYCAPEINDDDGEGTEQQDGDENRINAANAPAAGDEDD